MALQVSRGEDPRSPSRGLRGTASFLYRDTRPSAAAPTTQRPHPVAGAGLFDVEKQPVFTRHLRKAPALDRGKSKWKKRYLRKHHSRTA